MNSAFDTFILWKELEMFLLPRSACLRPLAAAVRPPSPRHLRERTPLTNVKMTERFLRKHLLAPPDTCAVTSPECL